MEPKFEDFLVRTGGHTTTLALLMACSLLLSLSFLPMSPVAAQNVSYSIMVLAHYVLEQVDAGVPIYLDDHYTGFSTPHQFTNLKGIHKLSSVNEQQSGHFIQGPPTLETNVSTAGFTVVSEDVNWIEIGPPKTTGSTAVIEFNYGPTPFVETMRGTFQPGTVVRLGLVVNMDPARIAEGHIDVYNQTKVLESSNAQPFYSAEFTIQGVQPTYVQFQIPQGAREGFWAYRVTLQDTNLNFIEDSAFEVARIFAVPVTYPADLALPFSTFELGGSQYMLFDNPNSSTVVMYVGGGMIGAISGPMPINGFSEPGKLSSGSYRLVYDLVKSGFSVVSPNGPWQGLDFPSGLVEHLRVQGFNRFYAIGHSAGGVVVAWTILNDPGLFSKAVIADAPLTQGSTGFYFTDLSVRSEQVRVPHLLVWGRGDTQAGLGDAFAWMDHADPSLAALEIYDYYHDWAGTAAELQVRRQIVGFLEGENPTAHIGNSYPDSSGFMAEFGNLPFHGNMLGVVAVGLCLALSSSIAYVFKKRKEKQGSASK
jgi:hypothetical protein